MIMNPHVLCHLKGLHTGPTTRKALRFRGHGPIALLTSGQPPPAAVGAAAVHRRHLSAPQGRSPHLYGKRYIRRSVHIASPWWMLVSSWQIAVDINAGMTMHLVEPLNLRFSRDPPLTLL